MSGKPPGKDTFKIQNYFLLRNRSKLKRKTVFLGSWSRLSLEASVLGCLSLPTARDLTGTSLRAPASRHHSCRTSAAVGTQAAPGHSLPPPLPPTCRGWRDPHEGTCAAPRRAVSPGITSRSHLRWSVCTPAAWARHRAGSPSSAGLTRSPGRTGLCWMSPSLVGTRLSPPPAHSPP